MRTEEDKIGSGRFVFPTANTILPPTRRYQLQTPVGIDYEHAYHFGGKVSGEFTRNVNRRRDN